VIEEEEEVWLMKGSLFSSVIQRENQQFPSNNDRERNRQTNSRSRMSSGQSKENRQGNLSKSKRKGKESQ
jgi:hypothetical protein